MAKLWNRIFGGRARKGKIKAAAVSRKGGKAAVRGRRGKGGTHLSYTREITHGKRGKLIQAVDIYRTKKTHEATIFVKGEGGETVAHLTVGIARAWLERNNIEGGVFISAVYVDKAYRKEGFLRQMAAEAEHVAKKELKSDRVFIVPQDRKVRKIYEKLGYEPFRRDGKIVRSGWKKMPILVKAL